MSEQTKIEWADSTASPWTGCTEASPGCANCYAREMAKRHGWCEWGKDNPRHRFEGFHANVMRMNRKPWVCESCGVAYAHPQQHECPTISKVLAMPDETNWRRRRIFPSACDWLDSEVPIEWLAGLLGTIHQTPNLDWLLLTKRPENFLKQAWACFDKLPRLHAVLGEVNNWLRNWICEDYGKVAPANVWIGASVENQEMADRRIPQLLQIPAKIRFLSLEPLVGPINIIRWIGSTHYTRQWKDVNGVPAIDWVIVGGESGPKARPCNIEWIRDIVRQCKAAGVPIFVKQVGSNCACTWTSGTNHKRYPNTIHPKGGDMSEWSKDIQVREFPNT